MSKKQNKNSKISKSAFSAVEKVVSTAGIVSETCLIYSKKEALMKTNAVAKGHKAPLSKRLKRDWHKNKWKYIMILPVLIYLFLFLL